ncbi:MAG: hypothetical protein ACTHZ5_01925 [Micrococcaceae bacterium]
MGQPSKKKGFSATIKAPLIFSAVLGLVGGSVATLATTGGTDKPLRIDIGLIAFGVFFMVSLVVVAMLQLASKDNPNHLSEGSGINRSSAELHRAAIAKQRQKLREEREAEQRRQQGDAEPTYGQRRDDDGSDPTAQS